MCNEHSFFLALDSFVAKFECFVLVICFYFLYENCLVVNENRAVYSLMGQIFFYLWVLHSNVYTNFT